MYENAENTADLKTEQRDMYDNLHIKAVIQVTSTATHLIRHRPAR